MKLEALRAELDRIERRRAQIEQRIKSRSEALYTSLPRKVGLKSVDALIMALVPYTSAAIRQKLQGSAPALAKAAPAKGAGPAKTATAKTGRRGGKRERVPEEKKAAIRRELQGAKMPMRQIAAKHAVPFETLKKWKRNWGLTSPRRR